MGQGSIFMHIWPLSVCIVSLSGDIKGARAPPQGTVWSKSLNRKLASVDSWNTHIYPGEELVESLRGPREEHLGVHGGFPIKSRGIYWVGILHLI